MLGSIPCHVAIIPDGNRRWAKENKLNAFKGHEKGLGAFEEVAKHAVDRGVEHLSLWGMSIDNFTKRSKEEVAWLQRIFSTEFKKLATSKDIHDRQTRIRVFGRWQELFSASAKKSIVEAVEATKDYDKNYLNFFLAYNGTDEMLQAVQSIVDEGEKEVTEDVLKKHLYTRDLPPVDLVIRTGGEPHLSAGFMMWDVADAQLYFTDKYWPDFDEEEFDVALGDYGERKRRKGR
jgi:undecaprenyl diphosphate synthase